MSDVATYCAIQDAEPRWWGDQTRSHAGQAGEHVMKPSLDFKSIIESGRSIRVGILLFPDVEVLDFAGPFEVFSVAARILTADRQSQPPVFEVTTVAATGDLVRARHGLEVVPAFAFNNSPVYDVLIVPGGVVAEPLNSMQTLDYVRSASRSSLVTASVCTGVFILAKAGIVDDHQVTTHWEDIADLKAAFPRLTVLEDVPFVDLQTIVTSAGISAGINMSLHIVGRILGTAAARKVARQMQYDWDGTDSAAIIGGTIEREIPADE